MKTCPVCKQDISDSDILCQECLHKVNENEAPRKESVLYSWGRWLIVFLCVLFFLRGAYALLSPESYKQIGEEIGFRSPGDTVHYFNTMLLLLTGTLYGITWIGGYLEKKWHRKLCLVTIILFIIGQLIIQLSGAKSVEGIAKAFALIFMWVSIPVFQYTAFSMGKPYSVQTTEDRKQNSEGRG